MAYRSDSHPSLLSVVPHSCTQQLRFGYYFPHPSAPGLYHKGKGSFSVPSCGLPSSPTSSTGSMLAGETLLHRIRGPGPTPNALRPGACA